jgi:hypothetical protein
MNQQSRRIWYLETLRQEALKHKTKREFKNKNPSAYTVACKLKILESICAHMPEVINKPISDRKAKEEALKYTTRGDFQKYSPKAYTAALKRGFLPEICKNMSSPHEIWTVEKLQIEALKYKKRGEFKRNNPSAYAITRMRGLLNQICGHMEKSGGVSILEMELFEQILAIHPSAKRRRFTKLTITGKPLITCLEIDIYIPELKKGIEFDGMYWHSAKGLKRSRPDWSEEDLLNYHEIKDSYFLSQGIQILHIREKDWLKDKEVCIKRCLEFLKTKESKDVR